MLCWAQAQLRHQMGVARRSASSNAQTNSEGKNVYNCKTFHRGISTLHYIASADQRSAGNLQTTLKGKRMDTHILFWVAYTVIGLFFVVVGSGTLYDIVKGD